MRAIDPMGVFLMETKVSNGVVEKVVRKVGFSFLCRFPRLGTKGVLYLCGDRNWSLRQSRDLKICFIC